MSSGEDSDLTRSEQARINGLKGGRPRGPANLHQAHPLFLWEEGERIQPIAWINVRRYSADGPVDAPRVWPADELQTEEDLVAYFGGGVYELMGRNALPDGRPGMKIKTRRLKLEGPSKPFTGEQQSHTPTPTEAPASPFGGSGLDLMLAMMREDRREAEARDERRAAEQRAADERREAREAQRSQATTQLVIGALGAVAPLLQSIITRPPAAPAPSAADALMPLLTNVLTSKLGENPLENLKKILEVAKEIKPDAPTAPPESLPQLLEGFGQAAAGIAQLEAMRIQAAKEGALSPAPAMPGAPPPSPTIPAPPPMPREEVESPAARLDS